MTSLGSVIKVNIGVAAASTAYYLSQAGTSELFKVLASPSTFVHQPKELRMALFLAGGSTLFSGISALEKILFQEDGTGLSIFSTNIWRMCCIPVQIVQPHNSRQKIMWRLTMSDNYLKPYFFRPRHIFFKFQSFCAFSCREASR